MKHILLIEDDPFIIEIYASRLKREGYVISVAKHGREAMEKIKNHWPDLIFLDINLPGEMSGWEFLEILKSDKRTSNLKVVVISNYSSESFKGEISTLKPDGYFLKAETSVDEITKKANELLI